MSSNTRRASGQNTCSAFSPFARNDEDWTKETDPAVRRQWQNRIAQRVNRAKNGDEKKTKKEEKRQRQQQQQEKRRRRRGAATPPSSNDALLSATSSSPMTQEGSPSTGTAIDATFSSPQQMDLYSRLLPSQDVSGHGNRFPQTPQAFFSQPMMSTPIHAPFEGSAEMIPASGVSYAQYTTYADSPPLYRQFDGPIYPSHVPIAGSSMTTASGHTITPTAPVDQAGYHPVNNGPSYGFGYTQAYGNLQIPSTEAYTDPGTSGYVARCFPPNYPSS